LHSQSRTAKQAPLRYLADKLTFISFQKVVLLTNEPTVELLTPGHI